MLHRAAGPRLRTECTEHMRLREKLLPGTWLGGWLAGFRFSTGFEIKRKYKASNCDRDGQVLFSLDLRNVLD